MTMYGDYIDEHGVHRNIGPEQMDHLLEEGEKGLELGAKGAALGLSVLLVPLVVIGAIAYFLLKKK